MIRRIVCFLLAWAGVSLAAPSPTGVYNAASWVPAGLPNSSIAQGSIFVVTGSGMGPAILQQVTSYPLPTSAGLAGTTIQVTVGGVATDCIMIYTVANQLAAILPSATALGSGTLTISYQGSQAEIPIQVVKSSFGIFAINQQGSGPGVVTDGNYQIRVPYDAAHPGDTLIIWGTGLGPITGDETTAPTQVNLNTGVQVFVGGQQANVVYGGRGSSPGEDQINFTVPSGLSGCYVSVVVKVGGVVSNFATIPITAAGQNFCSDLGGLTTADLTKLQNGGTLNTARIDIDTIAGNNAGARFEQWNSATFIASHGLSGGPSQGSCMVYNITAGEGIITSDPFAVPALDAGTQLNLTGPNGNKTLSLLSPGVYGAALSAKGQPAFLAPGNYTIDNGAGGTDIGAFKAALTMPQPLVWTNKTSISSVSASQDLDITWSGAGAGDVVSIIGVTGLASIKKATEFFCEAPGSAGHFTIPSLVFALLPPAGIESNGLPGMDILVGVIHNFPESTFTAPNLDYGLFFSYNDTGAAAILSIQ